ncbi:MAG: IPT/TIG domain-containing protein [Planctomycetes bacterium]|nr:IPT/TIG domain-containing protein [Planctomycetota bacterium]
MHRFAHGMAVFLVALGCQGERRVRTVLLPATTVVAGSQGNAPLAVNGILPTQGPPGTMVDIQGTGFDPAPASNLVRFGPTVATVWYATATLLRAEAPAGAQSAPVSVTVAGQTVQGPLYTITPPAPAPALPTPSAPIVYWAHPNPARVGEEVELVVSGLDGRLWAHQLFLGAMPIPLVPGPRQLAGWTPAQPTGSLQFTVPAGATSGDLVIDVLGKLSAPYPLVVDRTPRQTQPLPLPSTPPAPVAPAVPPVVAPANPTTPAPVAPAPTVLAPRVHALTPPSAVPGQEVQIYAEALDPILANHRVLVDGQPAAIDTAINSGGAPLGYHPATGKGYIRFTVPATTRPAKQVSVVLERGGVAATPLSLEVVPSPVLPATPPPALKVGDTLAIEGKGIESFRLHLVQAVFRTATGELKTPVTRASANGVSPLVRIETTVPREAVSGAVAVEVLGLRSKASLTLYVAGTPAPVGTVPAGWAATPVIVPGMTHALRKGVNHVVWRGPAGTDTAAATASIRGNLASVQRYDPAAASYTAAYFPTGPVFLHSLATLEPGDLLGITVHTDVLWRP